MMHMMDGQIGKFSLCAAYSLRAHILLSSVFALAFRKRLGCKEGTGRTRSQTKDRRAILRLPPLQVLPCSTLFQLVTPVSLSPLFRSRTQYPHLLGPHLHRVHTLNALCIVSAHPLSNIFSLSPSPLNPQPRCDTTYSLPAGHNSICAADSYATHELH